MDSKTTYELLDSIYAALPELHRDEFAMLMEEVRNEYGDPYRTINRWLSDHGWKKPNRQTEMQFPPHSKEECVNAMCKKHYP